MSRTHGQIRLHPRFIVVEDDGRSWKAALLLPPRPRGAVIFGGATDSKPGTPSILLDALVDTGLAVLQLPYLRQKNQAEHLRRLVRSAHRWLAGQSWATDLRQGLLGCGPMAAIVLDSAAWTENPLRAVAVYEGTSDMSEADLDAVRVPTLFVTSKEHPQEEELHREMAYSLRCESKLLVLDNSLVPAKAVAEWFIDHFRAQIEASPLAELQDSEVETFHGFSPIMA